MIINIFISSCVGDFIHLKFNPNLGVGSILLLSWPQNLYFLEYDHVDALGSLYRRV